MEIEWNILIFKCKTISLLPFLRSAAASETMHKCSDIPITSGRNSMPSFNSVVGLQFAASATIEQIVLRRRRSPTQPSEGLSEGKLQPSVQQFQHFLCQVLLETSNFIFKLKKKNARAQMKKMHLKK